jgi:hypothetical protein
MGWFTLKQVPTIGKVLMITFWALFAPNGMPTVFKVTMVQHLDQVCSKSGAYHTQGSNGDNANH